MKPAEFLKSFSPFLFLAILMGIVVSVLNHLTEMDSNVLRLALMVCAGAILYLTSVFLVRRAFLKDVMSMIWSDKCAESQVTC
jgi:hypothetical protein